MTKLTEMMRRFSEMNPEEQLEQIRDIRRNRYVTKPKAEARKRASGKKKIPKAEKLLAALSPEERAELLKEFDIE